MTDFRLVRCLRAYSGGTVPDLDRISYSPSTLKRNRWHSSVYELTVIILPLKSIVKSVFAAQEHTKGAFPPTKNTGTVPFITHQIPLVRLGTLPPHTTIQRKIKGVVWFGDQPKETTVRIQVSYSPTQSPTITWSVLLSNLLINPANTL